MKSPEQRFEVMMTGLNTSVLQQFWKEENNTGAETTRRVGIDKIIPGIRRMLWPTLSQTILGCQIDAFQFDPCGYSANALLAGGYYWTIHVTPEREFSYASFETNFPLSDYQNLLERVLSIFKPAHFNVVLMANQVWYYFFFWEIMLFLAVRGWCCQSNEMRWIQIFAVSCTRCYSNKIPELRRTLLFLWCQFSCRPLLILSVKK